MPMLDQTAAIMTAKLTPPRLDQSVADANSFAALPLPAGFVFPKDEYRRQKLQEYLNALPIGIQESIRSAIYLALTSVPPKPMTFKWAGAYDYKIEHTETYDTYHSPKSPGVIGITLYGRYPDDPHPLAAYLSPPGGRRASSSKRTAKGAPKPAKRRPSKRS
jgi:hypothetical protein